MADESNEITEERFRMVLKIVRENIPEPAGDWLRRVIRQTPQVVREGKKKTIFVNFMNICNTMHRQPHHVSAYLCYEFGTRCSFDEQKRWVVMGRFKLEHFEAFLRRYVVEYALCLKCKSVDTILPKDNRVFVLRCEKRFRMVLKIVRENIPEPAGDWLRRVIRLQTPQIVREREKKTAFVNFMDICNTCSFDEQQRWVVLGRFKLKNLEALLRRYVIEYVVCLIYQKENRVFVLRCEKCGSRWKAWQIPWKY